MIKSYGKYILSVIGAAFFGLLIQVLVTTPLRMIFEGNRNLLNTIACICCVLGSMVMLFFLTKKYGYDGQKPDKPLMDMKTVLLPCVLAVVIYGALTVILRYNTGAATNVTVLARVFGNLAETVDITEMAAEHGGLMFLSLVIQTLPFIPVMLAGYFVGGKKRTRDRAQFHEEVK